LQFPETSVRVGDSWSLQGAHWITVDGPLAVESEFNHNRVQFAALGKDSAGRRVATLDYVIAQQVMGKRESSASANRTTWFEFSLVARAEFLVDQGRWKRFSGRMDFGSNLQGSSSSHQLLVLTPMPVSGRLEQLK